MFSTMSVSLSERVKYKAIILDLDDTTVVAGKKSFPTSRVTKAIAKAKERIHVGIATARPFLEAKPVMDHLKLSGPCVINNGTQIYDPVLKKMIREVELPAGALEKVYALCQKHHLQIFLYEGKLDYEYFGTTIPQKALSIYLPKIDPKKIDEFVKLFAVESHIHVQKIPAWDARFMAIHIAHAEATKLHGIVEVARILDITTEEIIGVGDGYNDFPLLMACGLKIAMGNAVPELKAIADFVAPTVSDDGVATIIEKFILP